MKSIINFSFIPVTLAVAILITLLHLEIALGSPTTLQPQDQEDGLETTTQAFYVDDTEVLELKADNDVVAENIPQVTTLEPVQNSSTSTTTESHVRIVIGSREVAVAEKSAKDDSEDVDDTEQEGGDDEEEEDGPDGPPSQFGPRPPRPRPGHLKPGSLYQVTSNSSRPERIPPISAAQQQKDATSTTQAPPESSDSSTQRKGIRTTSVPKSTTAKSTFIRRKPSTPKPKTTTQKPLSFAEEFNLTNFFHTHTGPQGRADCECGKVPFKLENADAAGVNVYPWVVAIVRAGIFGGGRPHCGGTLINDRFVVTAVHCVLDLYAEDIQVWLTAHNSFQPNDNFVQSDRIVKRNIAEILMHPNYNRRTHDNDIALLKLGTTVDISSSSYFTPICLAAADNSYAGLTARIVGWSSSSGSNRFSSHKLCKDDVPVISNDVCIRDTVHGDKVTGNMMCAGLLTPERSQECVGDAGSGLTIPNGGRYTLIGVVSWGYSNRQAAYSPTVYAKVSGYSDWILHNTREADWCVV